MANYCGDCEKLDKNDHRSWENDYYCPETRKYKKLNDSACDKYIPKREGGYQPAGCFITTVICQSLGYRDNCEYLVILRNFREIYLKSFPAGIKLLQEYDQIGPILSMELANCPTIDAIMLMKRFIIPCTDAIKSKKYDDAIAIYENMVNELKERFRYTLDTFKVDYTIETPIEELGKARARLKPANA